MQGKLAIAIIFIALCARVPSTQAQNIHKCGNTYSQQPCPGGSVVETGIAPAPTSTQKAQTDAATRRDEKAAAAMEKARLKAEAQPAAVYIPPPKSEAADDANRPAVKLKKPEVFIASVPQKPGEKPHKKKKAKKRQQA